MAIGGADRVLSVAGVPWGYRVAETDEKVLSEPELVTRFRWRAERRRRALEAARTVPSYRYEVLREDGRYAVYAMQNVLEKIEP
jgi:hypothetical protein